MEELLDVTPSSVEISQEWRARKGIRGNVIYGKSKVDTLLAKWHPLNNLYVGFPNNSEFNLAIDLKELQETIYLSYARRNRLSIVILAVATTVIAGIGWLREESAKVHLGLALASLVFFMTLDYFMCTRNSNMLFERSKFYLLLRQKGYLDCIFWSGFMAVIGVIQICAQSQLGDFEEVLTRYGVFYEALGNGEWWRLFTGPFLHVSTIHWLANLASLLLIVGFGGIISRHLTIFTFLISSAIGAYIAWSLSSYTHQEAYAGVSGGIFGIFGMCASFSLCRPNYFPNKIWIIITAFSVTNIFISSVAVSNSSLEGHIAGFITGFVFGTVYARVEKFKTPPIQFSRAPAPTRSAHAPAADSPH